MLFNFVCCKYMFLQQRDVWAVCQRESERSWGHRSFCCITTLSSCSHRHNANDFTVKLCQKQKYQVCKCCKVGNRPYSAVTYNNRQME